MAFPAPPPPPPNPPPPELAWSWAPLTLPPPHHASAGASHRPPRLLHLPPAPAAGHSHTQIGPIQRTSVSAPYRQPIPREESDPRIPTHLPVPASPLAPRGAPPPPLPLRSVAMPRTPRRPRRPRHAYHRPVVHAHAPVAQGHHIQKRVTRLPQISLSPPPSLLPTLVLSSLDAADQPPTLPPWIKVIATWTWSAGLYPP